MAELPKPAPIISIGGHAVRISVKKHRGYALGADLLVAECQLCGEMFEDDVNPQISIKTSWDKPKYIQHRSAWKKLNCHYTKS